LTSGFPLAPWLGFLFFTLTASSLTYMTWSGRGPSWLYDQSSKRYPSRKLIYSGQLPVAAMFGCITLVVLARYAQKHSHGVANELAAVCVWLLIGLAALSGVAMVVVFLTSSPQFLVAPPYRPNPSGLGDRGPRL
jgi:hypothetical protein